MRDIDVAGRAVVDHPAVAPTAVETITANGRRRQRRRVSVAAALATVVVLVGAVVGIGVSRRTTTNRVAVGPRDSGSVTDPLMRAHLGLDAPSGWVPVDYGDARLFVPPTWKVTAGGCGGPAPGWVEVGGPYKQTCGVAAPTFIDIERFVGEHRAKLARVIHGYALYASVDDPSAFVIPALHVTIHAEGPDRDKALATLAPSSRLIALTYKGAVPSGWDRVGYSGISLSYPPDWPDQAVGSCGTVPPAQVTLDDVSGPGCGAGGQPDTGPTRDGVRIGRAQPWLASTEPKQTAITNGSTSLLLQPGPDDRSLTVVVQLNATNGVPVEIGLGIDGRVAAAVLNSIQVDGNPTPATTTTSIAAAAAGATVPTITGDWQPISIAGYSGPLTSPPLGYPPMLRFDAENKWSGSDGCNDTGPASYRWEPGGTFHISGEAAQTQVGCESVRGAAPVPTVPTWATIQATVRVDVVDNHLTLFDRNGRTLAIYARVNTATPTTSTSDCTAQNNEARAVVAQPTSFRLDRARTYSSGQISLDPPRASDTPNRLASKAWTQSTMSVAQNGSTYELVLARYSYLAHGAGTLAWIVIGHHVPIISEGPADLSGTTPKSQPPTCGEELDIFDAATGKGLGITSFGSG